MNRSHAVLLRNARQFGTPKVQVGAPEPVRGCRLFATRGAYCDGLGFKPVGHVDLPVAHIEAFRFGDCLLKLTLFQNIGLRPQPRQPDPTAFYMTLRVSALDQLLSRCLASGGSLLVPISSAQTKELQNVQFAFVTDPMGNRIELVEGNAWST